MKILILTQIVDVKDTSLSFFHRWLEEFAPHYEQIIVVCLKEGTHSLPANVRVYSLGKETGPSRLKYVARLFRYAIAFRHEYEAVFVHMNQEYIVLAGWLWRLMGKRLYMWRNYHTGNWLTDVAAFFCNKVFCTSTFSYTARYRKTVIMPVGVDLSGFSDMHMLPKPNSILSFGRIAGSKRIECFIEALGMLRDKGLSFTADIYGDPLPQDEPYRERLKAYVAELDLSDRVAFHAGVPNSEASRIFAEHEIFVNASPSGMYDKMIFEAAASGSLSLASSHDWAALVDLRLAFDGSAEDLARALEGLLTLPQEEKDRLQQGSLAAVEKNSLGALARRLMVELAD